MLNSIPPHKNGRNTVQKIVINATTVIFPRWPQNGECVFGARVWHTFHACRMPFLSSRVAYWWFCAWKIIKSSINFHLSHVHILRCQRCRIIQIINKADFWCGLLSSSCSLPLLDVPPSGDTELLALFSFSFFYLRCVWMTMKTQTLHKRGVSVWFFIAKIITCSVPQTTRTQRLAARRFRFSSSKT